MKTADQLLDHCLYFTTAKLHRALERLAEESFSDSGLAPSHAFLLMTVHDRSGIGLGELARILHLAPSTLTRFVDKLEEGGVLTRRKSGRSTAIEVTMKGKRLREKLDRGWMDLYRRYSEILGEDEGNHLAAAIDSAGDELEKAESGA